MDFWTSWAVNTFITVLRVTVKNPTKRERLRGVFLNVRDAINAAYPEDASGVFPFSPPKE